VGSEFSVRSIAPMIHDLDLSNTLKQNRSSTALQLRSLTIAKSFLKAADRLVG